MVERELSKTAARENETREQVRHILAISTVAVIVALIIAYVPV